MLKYAQDLWNTMYSKIMAELSTCMWKCELIITSLCLGLPSMVRLVRVVILQSYMRWWTTETKSLLRWRGCRFPWVHGRKSNVPTLQYAGALMLRGNCCSNYLMKKVKLCVLDRK